MLVEPGQMRDETGVSHINAAEFTARGAARPPRVTRTASGLAGASYDMKNDLFSRQRTFLKRRPLKRMTAESVRADMPIICPSMQRGKEVVQCRALKPPNGWAQI